MRFAGGAGAIGGVRGRLIGTAAVLAALVGVALLPAGAGAQSTGKNCSSAGIHHLSNLGETRSSCAEARKVAKYAEAHSATYVPKHYGFKCHGTGQFGAPPISYTCKKGNARVYFTLSN
jgi:hypothetical protein